MVTILEHGAVMTTKIQANTENYQKLKRVLEDLAGAKLKVGFFDGKKEKDSELTLATIAKINEYGDGKNIPPRPFMRQTLNKNKDFKKDIEDAVRDTINFKASFKSAFRKVGVKAMQEMQLEITNGSFKENSEYTKKKKKSSKPLIDKGHLRRNVSWRVEK
jgi:hypothetical protein